MKICISIGWNISLDVKSKLICQIIYRDKHYKTDSQIVSLASSEISPSFIDLIHHKASVATSITLLHMLNVQCIGISSTVVNAIFQIAAILLPLKG